MSDAVGLNRLTATWETPAVKPLDDAVWEAWKAQGRHRDRQGRERRMKALTWGLSVGLIFVAGLWSHLGSYEVAIRCVLAVVAAGMIFEAFKERQYPFGWQRAFLLASAVPFLTSFAARDSKGARID